MKTVRQALAALALFGLTQSVASEQEKVRYLKFPVTGAASLGQVDQLVVTVSCGWIAGLKNVPELYNISLEYDIPTENKLQAQPRLGAAAVDLARWSGVIGVRLPSDADAKSCFAVTVTAQGRNGVEVRWTGQQLGLNK